MVYFRFYGVLILVLAMLTCFAAGDDGIKDKVVDGKTDNTASITDLTDPTELLKVYIDPSSAEYKGTGKVTDTLQTGLKSDMSISIRFVPALDGVTVTLESGTWNPFHSYYEVTDEIFTVETKKGRVYSFEGFISETIPQLQLVATYRGLQCIWPLQYDQVDGSVVFTIIGEPWQARALDESSNMINLCAAYAISFYDSYYDTGYPDNGAIKTDDLWKTVAMAITLNHASFMSGDDDSDIFISKSALDSFARIMFPNQTKMPAMPKGEFTLDNGVYSVMPRYLPIAWDFAYCGENENEKGWVVAIGVEDVENGRQLITFQVYLTANEKYSVDSPFEYHITGIDILGGF